VWLVPRGRLRWRAGPAGAIAGFSPDGKLGGRRPVPKDSLDLAVENAARSYLNAPRQNESPLHLFRGEFMAGYDDLPAPAWIEKQRARLNDLENQLLVTDARAAKQRGETLDHTIFYGPPGLGKTTIAHIIAREMGGTLRATSGLVLAHAGDLAAILTNLQEQDVLFIDEIHRYNKSQQDSLLAAVEKGQITLIGATTENPSFELNSAVLSRCQVYILEAFGEKELKELTERALREDAILKEKNIKVESYDALMRVSGGDGRKLLNLLELITFSYPPDAEIIINDGLVKEIAQLNSFLIDRRKLPLLPKELTDKLGYNSA